MTAHLKQASRSHPATIAAMLLLTAGCGNRDAEGLHRFQQLTLSPCPLFSDDILSWEGLPACPFPAFQDIERPCAIEYYVEGDPNPRARRSLSFDSAGRVTAFSDSRQATVVESRRIYYERQGDSWLSHHYAEHCSEPAPKFLYTLAETWDEAERPMDLSSGHLHWGISYYFGPHLFRDDAKVLVHEGTQPRYALQLDHGGHVVGKQESHAKSTTQLDVRNGFIHSARWVDNTGEEYARAQYTYQGHRLVALDLRYPTAVMQTYRFDYACDDNPTCAAGNASDTVVTPLTPTAFSRDPKLSRFVAHNCSDQLAHGPQICAQVLRGEQGLSARCCHGDEDGFSLEIRNQFAGPAVLALNLKLTDGRELTTDFCRSDKYYSVCRIKRSALRDLPEGMVTLEMTTKSGQAIHVLAVNADELHKAAE